MRKAKGLLSIVAGLVLMFQAGTTVAYADDSRHKATAKSEDKSQVAAKAEAKSSERERELVQRQQGLVQRERVLVFVKRQGSRSREVELRSKVCRDADLSDDLAEQHQQQPERQQR